MEKIWPFPVNSHSKGIPSLGRIGHSYVPPIRHHILHASYFIRGDPYPARLAPGQLVLDGRHARVRLHAGGAVLSCMYVASSECCVVLGDEVVLARGA